jgi:hypothetical protein
MKGLLIVCALFGAQASYAASSKATVSKLECSAVNSLGYASLKLDKNNQVNIVVNNAYSIKTQIVRVEPTLITLAQASGQEYLLEFKAPLTYGSQKVQASLYNKFSKSAPAVLASFADCELALEVDL